MEGRKILFVCSFNMDRSPTAEALVNQSGKYEARSCGADPEARVAITKELVGWADVVFVMEDWQKEGVLRLDSEKDVRVLDVPNMFRRGDPELIRILREKLKEYL